MGRFEGLIDFRLDEMPQSAQEDIAQATLEMVRRFFAQPGTQERFEAWKAERDARKAKA